MTSELRRQAKNCCNFKANLNDFRPYFNKEKKKMKFK